MFKRLPPLNSLKAFESAARNLSFTKAAEELFVTQAAVSHQIKLLEDFLGFPLFVRKSRALELTEKGEQYFTEIALLLHKLLECTQKIMAQNRPHLTISVPQTFGMHWLVPHLANFHERYPNIDVRIKAAEQDDGLLSNDVDIAIYYGRGNWDNLKAELLSQEQVVMLASPQLLAVNPVDSPADLNKHQLIHVHTRENWQNMAHYLKLDNLDTQQGVVFSHTFMGLQAARLGQGIVLANRILALQEIKNGNLQIVMPTQLQDSKAFYVVNAQTKTDDQPIVTFREWIVQEMKNKYE